VIEEDLVTVCLTKAYTVKHFPVNR